MPQRVDLFSLAATTPDGGIARTNAAARASATASVELRRGLDLRLGFDFEASAQGAIGGELSGKLSAGVSARAGLAVQAMVPIDLFDEAGLVVRFQAQAEAAAYASLAISLELGELYRRVGLRVPSPLDELLTVFFDEVECSAGLWARVAFAAQVHGQAVLSGSLLPNVAGGPGFAFRVGYGAGLGFGSGKDFVANIGIPDPARLLDRLAGALTDVVLDQAERHFATRPDAERIVAGAALTAARVSVPLATRTLFRIGLELVGSPDGAQARDASNDAVLDALFQQTQTVVLEALAEMAFAELGRQVRGLVGPQLNVDEAQRVAMLAALDDLDAALDTLAATDAATPEAFIAAIAPVVAAVEALARGGGFDASAALDAAAALWTAAVLAERVSHWYDAPDRDVNDLFGAAAAPFPVGSALAAHVARRIGMAPGRAVTLADLVEFLVEETHILDELRSFAPELADGIDWLSGLLGGLPSDLLRVALRGTPASPDTRAALATRVGTALGAAVRDEVVPRLLAPMKAQQPNAKGLHLVIDELVTPMLVALPGVVLPALATLDDEEDVRRMREAVSALLLQLVGRLTIATVDVLLEHALNEAEEATNAVLAIIDDIDEEWSGFGAIATVAARAVLPVSLNIDDVKGLLRLAADVMSLVNDEQREPLMDVLGQLIRMGLATDAGFDAAMDTLLTTDAAPAADNLDAALARVQDGAWAIAGFVVPRALELVAMHFVHEAKRLAVAIYEGAKAVVEAVQKGLALLANTARELADRARVLAAQGLQLAAQVAGHIRGAAEHVRSLVAAIVAKVRAFGRSLLDPVIAWMPEWAQNELRNLYNTVFDAVRWMLDAPLALLSSVAGWAEQALSSASAALSNPDAVRQEVRRKIESSSGLDIHFDLALWAFGAKIFDAGRITIPTGKILGIFGDVVLGDPVFHQSVNVASSATASLRAVRAEEATVQQLQAGVAAQQLAQADAARMVPGRALRAEIESPAHDAAVGGHATVRIRVTGANRSFVESTLGVEPRIVVRVNGHVYRYDASRWYEDANGVTLSLILIPAPAVAHVVLPAKAPVPLRLVEDSAVLARVGAASRVTFDADDDGPLGARVEVGASIAAMRAGTTTVSEHVRGVAASSFEVRAAAPRVRSLDELTVEAEQEAVALGLDPMTGDPIVGGMSGLNVVEVAVADGDTRRDSDRVVFFVTRSVPKVVVEQVVFDPAGPDIKHEYALIRNEAWDPVDVEGWTIEDLFGHRYTFGPRTIAARSAVRLYSGTGTDDGERVYWNRKQAVWTNTGDSAILRDASGREIHRYSYRVVGR
ncbi:MAG TPA: lamin tail domain-containing protein [Acidimicrobiales bacterium]